MKHFISAAIIFSMTAFTAAAQRAHVVLSAATQQEIHVLDPGADLSNLTNAQYAELVSLFSNGSNLSAGANPAGAVHAILIGH